MAKKHNAYLEIKLAVIAVPARFNKLQRDAIIEVWSRIRNI